MIQTSKSSTAESALHTIWENLETIANDYFSEECRAALRASSDGPIALNEEIAETAKRAFYTAWEVLDPAAYARKTWSENETRSGWELPSALPPLRPRVWQRIARRLREELPSNERLEHWAHRLFWVGFRATSSSPGYLSFALDVQGEVTRELLYQLRRLTDLARGTAMLTTGAVSVEDLAPNAPFVFRRQADEVIVRAFDAQYHFEFRREPIGFQYLDRLLRNPGQRLDPADLGGGPASSALDRETRLQSLYVRAYDDGHEPTDVQPPSLGFGWQAKADLKALRAVHARLAELRHDYDRAQRDVDLAAQARLAEEQQGLTTYLKQVTVPGSGRLRAFRDNQARMHRRHLASACERLEAAGLRKLARHLRQAIRIEGRHMAYCPSPEIRWAF